MVATCAFPANHGTPGAIRELSIHLADLGHQVHVITYPQQQDIPVPGLRIHRVSSDRGAPASLGIGPSFVRLGYDARMVSKLIEVVRGQDIQIIHAHNYEGAIVGALAKRATGRPLIYNGINSMADELPTYPVLRPRFLSRWLGKLLDLTVPRTGDLAIVLSDELGEYLQELGMSEERIITIPPGVDVDMFSQGDALKIRARYQIGRNDPLVMYTGALEAFQRLDYLLHAMRMVISTHANARLLLAGNIENQANKAKLLGLACELGIETSTLFVDKVELRELPDYLAAADVAVIPRPSCPGYPVKLLNYMAAGKAIVSFQGSAKSLCHGYNGYVARNHDVDDLAAGIDLLLDREDIRTALGQRARDSIAGVYDSRTIAEATAMIYRELIDGRGTLDKNRLSPLIKGSYSPRLPTEQNRGGFLRPGPIEYPSFAQVSAERSESKTRAS